MVVRKKGKIDINIVNENLWHLKSRKLLVVNIYQCKLEKMRGVPRRFALAGKVTFNQSVGLVLFKIVSNL